MPTLCPSGTVLQGPASGLESHSARCSHPVSLHPSSRLGAPHAPSRARPQGLGQAPLTSGSRGCVPHPPISSCHSSSSTSHGACLRDPTCLRAPRTSDHVCAHPQPRSQHTHHSHTHTSTHHTQTHTTHTRPYPTSISHTWLTLTKYTSLMHAHTRECTHTCTRACAHIQTEA